MLAYLVAALSPNMDVANAALPTYVVTLLFFVGFLLRWENIPVYWKWCVPLVHIHGRTHNRCSHSSWRWCRCRRGGGGGKRTPEVV